MLVATLAAAPETQGVLVSGLPTDTVLSFASWGASFGGPPGAKLGIVYRELTAAGRLSLRPPAPIQVEEVAGESLPP